MGALFGKSKSRVTEQDRAVLELKKQRDKLKLYQKKIELQLVKDRETAKSLLKDGKKEKAKLLLRKKKFQESLLEKTDKQLDTIDSLVHDLEFTQVEQQVVQGLKRGNEALKKMHELLSLEDVEKIMDETRDAVEYQKEIDQLLSGGLTEEDEEDVLNELNEIIKSSLPSIPENELPETEPELPETEPEFPETEPELPDVPSETPKARAKQKKETLAS